MVIWCVDVDVEVALAAMVEVRFVAFVDVVGAGNERGGPMIKVVWTTVTVALGVVLLLIRDGDDNDDDDVVVVMIGLVRSVDDELVVKLELVSEVIVELDVVAGVALIIGLEIGAVEVSLSEEDIDSGAVVLVTVSEVAVGVDWLEPKLEL